MNKEQVALGTAYSLTLSDILTDRQKKVLENNSVSERIVKDNIVKINSNELNELQKKAISIIQTIANTALINNQITDEQKNVLYDYNVDSVTLITAYRKLTLGTAHSFISSGGNLTKKQDDTLKKYNISLDAIEEYIKKIKGNILTKSEQIMIMRIYAIAYSVVLSNRLTDIQQEQLDQFNIDYPILEQYYMRDIKNNGITVDNQQKLEQTFNNIIDLGKYNASRAGSNSNSNTNSMEKAKVHTLTNGKKQIFTYDEDQAAFSDIYMFAFLVLLFQVLFLIISYMIFAK